MVPAGTTKSTARRIDAAIDKLLKQICMIPEV
jgi:hypothetical protein